MKIHGTAKGGAISKKDFGVAFGSPALCVGSGEQCYATGTVEEGNTGIDSAISNMYSSGCSGDCPVNCFVTEATFNCRTTKTGTSNVLYATIYDSAGDLQATSTNGINNNTLSGTGFTEMVFTFDGSYRLQDGDRIALFNTTGSNTNLRQAQESGFTDANPAMEEYQGGSWNGANTSYQIKQCVTWTS